MKTSSGSEDRRGRLLKVALVAVLVSGGSVSAAADRSSALVFNTVCSRCHEGECSGRLSFDSGPKAAEDHIRRYAGEVGEHVILGLFDVLRFTKEDCSYYPVEPWPAGGPLAHYRLPSATGYFIPFGRLGAGPRHLQLAAERTADIRVELMRADFELIYEDFFVPDQPLSAVVSLEEDAGYFLRVTSSRPMRLTALRFDPGQGN